MAKVILHQGKAGWDQQQVVELLKELGHEVELGDWPLGQERASFHRIEATEPIGKGKRGKEVEAP